MLNFLLFSILKIEPGGYFNVALAIRDLPFAGVTDVFVDVRLNECGLNIFV